MSLHPPSGLDTLAVGEEERGHRNPRRSPRTHEGGLPLLLQSIRSGSSGNCLLLENHETTLLIDAGFSSIRRCRAALEPLLPSVDGVLVSHLHSDHISYSTLRVLEEWGVPVWVCAGEEGTLRRKHFRGRPFDGLDLRTFTRRPVQIGSFTIQPFRVPHYPSYPTFGFDVASPHNGTTRRAVVASDLSDWMGQQSHFHNADVIYIEANHDPELLKLYWNPNSVYHLSNPSCAALLRHALDHSTTPPAAVMLGHLSDDRNSPELARDTVATALAEAGYAHVPIHVAPRDEPSNPLAIA